MVVPHTVFAEESAAPPGAALAGKTPAQSRADLAEAGNDRLILSPTAATLPEGVNSFSDYELILLQYSYGITDHLEISLLFTPPIVQISAYPSLKWQYLDTERVKLALEIHAGETFFYLLYPATGFIAGGSLIADFCFDRRCGSALSLSVQPDYMVPLSSSNSGTMGIRATLGARFDISKAIKGILEMTYAGLPVLKEGMLLLNYGIRIHGGRFAGDIGFVRPLFVHDSGNAYGIPKEYWSYLPLGIPWLGVTYQW
jgi:hypothetical protein